MTLNEQVHKFIQKENLLAKDSKVLLAVSGGVDSMVMLHILSQTSFDISVASVNYKLRDQSDVEEAMVKDFCLQHRVTHHGYVASSDDIADMQAGNLQAKARKVRYDFIEYLKEEYGYQYVMTAHHADDRIEGFFINALRGVGLNGLSSVQSNRSRVLRPLLNCRKDQIITYAKDHNVPYLEDHSNAESKYDRNFIRNKILPLVAKKFPNYLITLSRTLDNIKASNNLLKHLVNEKLTGFISHDDGITVINKWKEIKKLSHGEGLLYHTLQEYGYNLSDVKDMMKSEKTGAIFLSNTHEALLDRDRLVIRLKGNKVSSKINISGLGRCHLSDQEWFDLELVNAMIPDECENVGFFDFDKIHFPLEVRKWKHGDKFRPFGMKGQSRKVKDYLKDEKLSRFEKEEVKVLLDGEDICWIIGHRTSELYKVRSSTKKILRIAYQKSSV